MKTIVKAGSRVTHHRYVVDSDGVEWEVPFDVDDSLPIKIMPGEHETRIVYASDGGPDLWTDDYWGDQEGATFVEFSNGGQRNRWIADYWGDLEIVKAVDEGRFFWVERYQHGLVRYALENEASSIDRKWDVASAAAYLILDREWHGGHATPEQYAEVARNLLAEYTDWCNGNVYLLVEVFYDHTVGGGYEDHEVTGGYIGTDQIESAIRDAVASAGATL